MYHRDYEEGCNNGGTRPIHDLPASEQYLDKIAGSMIGGAVGDALGYVVEFFLLDEIKRNFGEAGITEYVSDPSSGKALISDDTQMALFTANGILVSETYACLHESGQSPLACIAQAYQDWLITQEVDFRTGMKLRRNGHKGTSWLLDVPQLYDQRAPGITCLSSLTEARHKGNFMRMSDNHSKGCGGIMRVAPLGLHHWKMDIRKLDREGAKTSAITHGHSLGYMPSAVCTHILNRIVYPIGEQSLKELICEARDTVAELFSGDAHLQELCDIINLAMKLAENKDSDTENIALLGGGWVAEETLAIALYCALRYEHDFSAGVIAAVNHSGDSDSTGAVAGNILGAINGYSAIEDKWKQDLELHDVILEIARDLCHGCQIYKDDLYRDEKWTRKYIQMHWKE